MYGKSRPEFRKFPEFSAKNRKNSTPHHSLWLKMGTDLGLMALHNRMYQIFDFLIFSQNMGIFRSKKWQISECLRF
jgi:hypothetical protein